MDKKIFKILVVGEKNTGKTQIIQAFNQYIPLNVSQVSYKTLNTQCETKSTSKIGNKHSTILDSEN